MWGLKGIQDYSTDFFYIAQIFAFFRNYDSGLSFAQTT